MRNRNTHHRQTGLVTVIYAADSAGMPAAFCEARSVFIREMISIVAHLSHKSTTHERLKP
jgi:hypothetical protein